jgi:hypothetical protein
MTDPSNNADPDCDAAAQGAPGGSPTTTIADHDGGVARRLTTRCRIAAAALLVIAGGSLLVGVLNELTVATALLLLLAAGGCAWGAMLLRRAGLWSSVAAAALPSSPGVPAAIGPPKRLSPGIPGAPVRRRLGAKVVPIHADVDRQPGDGALVVHARADGLELVAGDIVQAWTAARVALGSAAPAGPDRAAPARPEKGGSGRWVLCRAGDGAVFLATTHLADTW